MKRGTKIALGVVALVAIGGTAAAIYGRKDARLPRVSVEPATIKGLVSKVTCNGRIEAKKKVNLSATTSGQIINLAVREGDHVKKGDFLMQIDRTMLQAQADSSKAAMGALLHDLDAARANSERSRLEFERSERAYKSGIISESDYTRARTDYDAQKANFDSIEARIEQARASFVGARDTLSKTTISAPMEGIITRLQVEEGEVAMIGTMNNPGTELMTISDLSVIESEMQVDETEIPSVKVGQTATMTIDAYPGRKFEGVVTEIASSPVSATVSASATTGVDFLVKVRVDEPPPDLRPGLSCTADILTGTRDKALAVPIQSLVLREKPNGARGQEEEGLFVLEAGKVVFLAVKTGMTGDLDIEILSGATEGQQVVTGPFKTLRELKDGDRVMLEEPVKAGGSAKK